MGPTVHHRVTPPLTVPCVQVPKKHGKKEVAKQIREKAQPIVTWLRTAEEESSEDEDVEVRVGGWGGGGGEGVMYIAMSVSPPQVEYSKNATGSSIMMAETTPPKEEQQEEGADIDIDAI